jgi:hypothetical protein
MARWVSRAAAFSLSTARLTPCVTLSSPGSALSTDVTPFGDGRRSSRNGRLRCFAYSWVCSWPALALGSGRLGTRQMAQVPDGSSSSPLQARSNESRGSIAQAPRRSPTSLCCQGHREAIDIHADGGDRDRFRRVGDGDLPYFDLRRLADAIGGVQRVAG